MGEPLSAAHWHQVFKILCKNPLDNPVGYLVRELYIENLKKYWVFMFLNFQCVIVHVFLKVGVQKHCKLRGSCPRFSLQLRL